MMRFALTIALIVAVSTEASAQDTRAHDGNWWRAQSADFRLAYVIGTIDGMRLLAPPLIGANDDTNTVSRRAIEIVDDALPNATFGQLLDGLDTLFNDFRNRAIDVPLAFMIVFQQIKGVPQETVERELTKLRAIANQRPN